jgi:excinuclease ABC subunit C
MVVFTAGRPDKGQYRRFKIREEHVEANDFAMMSEVLSRRFAQKRIADKRFANLPDLIIVDGGKPQLTAAMSELARSELGDISLAGLAKRDEELFVPWSLDKPVVLPSGSAGLYLVKRIRDEAHRFAITFHREIRGKAATKSALDDIVGLGEKRKKTLLAKFGTVSKIREASVEELATTPGIPKSVAQAVYAAFNKVG